MKASETSRPKSAASTTTDISGKLTAGSYHDGHPGTTAEDVKPKPIFIGDNGSLLEVYECGTNV